MTASVISCPKCSQLNTTRRIICKTCGLNLRQAHNSEFGKVVEGPEQKVTGMGHILSILYFIYYLLLATGNIPLQLNEWDMYDKKPYWSTGLDIVFRGGAAVCILFYIIRFRPKTLVSLWKIVPVSLVMFDMFKLFYIGLHSGLNFQECTIPAIINVFFLSPSWYLCFRFGYLKEISMSKPEPLMRIKSWIRIVKTIVIIIVILYIALYLLSKLMSCPPGNVPEKVMQRRGMEFIGMGLDVYAKENDGKFPDKLSVLYPDYFRHIGTFFYYNEKLKIIKHRPEHWLKDYIDSKGCFKMVSGLSINSDPHHLLAYEKTNNHWEEAGRYEIFVDTHFEFCSNDYIKLDNFTNDYELKVINGDKVVINHATGLMWHQSGSDMPLSSVTGWVGKLNKSVYAGYNDWRLPTVEEAVSLFEPSKRNGDLYLNPLFDKKQSWIWSGKRNNDYTITYFESCHVCKGNTRSKSYVRPVRSMK